MVAVAAALPLRPLRSVGLSGESSHFVSMTLLRRWEDIASEKRVAGLRPVLDARYLVFLRTTHPGDRKRPPGAGFLAQSAAVPGRFHACAGPSWDL